MTNSIDLNESPTAFLNETRGHYKYRPWFGNLILWLGILSLLTLPLVAIEEFSNTNSFSLEKAKLCLVLIFTPYCVWTGYVIRWRFKELTISGDGIKILPYGLHLAPQDIEGIRYGKNYAGVKTIEIKPKTPHLIFHMIVWSFGRTITIAFNPRLLAPITPTTE